MSVEVRVTAVLQQVVGGVRAVQGDGKTVEQLLADLEQKYPGFKAQVIAADGQLHRFVNIYKNDEDIRYLGQLGTTVEQGDVISILPALAGGAADAPSMELARDTCQVRLSVCRNTAYYHTSLRR